MNEIVEYQEQLSLDDIKKYIAPTATDKELFMFTSICKQFNLNPIKREIHFIKYGDSDASYVVGYETYLKRAERSGLLDGWNVSVEKDSIGEKAVIEIKRKDRSNSFKWEVYRREFDKGRSVWKDMPYTMLKKVAISQGFRLCFPVELGGMPYTEDEIDVTPPAPIKQIEQVSTKPMDEMASTEQRKSINASRKELSISDEAIKKLIQDRYQVKTSAELTYAQAEDMLAYLGQEMDKQLKANTATVNQAAEIMDSEIVGWEPSVKFASWMQDRGINPQSVSEAWHKYSIEDCEKMSMQAMRDNSREQEAFLEKFMAA